MALALAACTADSDAIVRRGGEIIISSKPGCADCRIDLTRLVTLGDPDGDGALTAYMGVYFAGARGGWYSPSRDGFLIHFDNSGRFDGRIGRKGSGPGEMSRPMAVFRGPGDSLYVPDGARQTIHVFSDAGDYGRRFSAPSAGFMAVLGDGRLAIASMEPEAPDPVQLIDGSGNVVRRFGRLGADAPMAHSRGVVVLSSSSGGGVWLGQLGQYLITKWDTTGHELLRLRREADWFPIEPRSELEFGHLPPVMIAMQEDSVGLLWVLLRIPDRNIEKAHPGDSWKKEMSSESGMAEVVDYMLEAIDPKTGRLVASRRIDEFMMIGFTGPNQIATLTDTDAGIARATVWRFELKGYNRR
jgi:hypothetical protein